MKTLNRILGVVLGLYVGISAANAAQDGRGGGVLYLGKRTVTFASAGIKMKPQPLKVVPGKDFLDTVVSSLPLSQKYKNFFFEHYENMGHRQYYSLEASPKQLEKLLSQYRNMPQLAHVRDMTKIAAITTDAETILLSPFFALKTEPERAAILWHEQGWVSELFRTYEEAVESEGLFQKLAENIERTTYDYDFFMHLSKLMNDYSVALSAAVDADRKSGSLNQFIDAKGLLDLSFLINEKPLIENIINSYRTHRKNSEFIKVIYSIREFYSYTEYTTEESSGTTEKFKICYRDWEVRPPAVFSFTSAAEGKWTSVTAVTTVSCNKFVFELQRDVRTRVPVTVAVTL
ncbi:MAG: hypothetical protein K2X47_10525, partial [Bdellovibrionales bacterium]|nr:hypothetical protein [Bdellovibrionales bacterium]